MANDLQFNAKIVIERNLGLEKMILVGPGRIVNRHHTNIPIGARGRRAIVPQ